MLISGVSRRQIARTLRINFKTVERKLRLLARLSEEEMTRELLARKPEIEVQFDEVETFEHTKLKPLSIPLVVSSSRLVLGIGLAQMPAKGLLAKISRKKYGPRKDFRDQEIRSVLLQSKKFIAEACHFTTDKKASYPNHLKALWPELRHTTTNGGRGAIAGYGELKKKSFDIMFALNHTAAMFRDHLATLKRRTWTTTKKPANLLLLLKIYAREHNRLILES